MSSRSAGLLIMLLLVSLLAFPLVEAQAQFARPDSDVVDGGWKNTITGNAVDNFAAIDEVTASDVDYDYTGNNPANDELEVGLSDVTDPQSSTGHVVRYRIGKENNLNKVLDFTVRLRQGATEIAAWTHTDIAAGPTTFSQTLSGVQADAITDYTDLRLEFIANFVSGSGGPVRGTVTWAELETPAPPTTPPTVTTNAATDVTYESATLNGNLDSLGTAASVDVSFEWGPESAPPFSFGTTPETKTATGAFSAGITGLDAETTYSFRAKAVGDGTAFGSVLSFTTDAAPPPWSNTAPSIDQSFTTREGGHNISYSEALTATDPDANQTLSWSLNTNASFLALEQADRSAWVNGTPAFAHRDQSYYVEVTVDDQGCSGGCALTDTLNWTLYINDTAPVLSNPIANDEGGHNISYSQDFDFTDANSDTGIWSLESNGTFLSISAAGTVSGTPAFADRDSQFYVDAIITDYEGGLSDSTNYTLYINDTAPVLSNPILTDEAGHNISYSRDFDFTDTNADSGIWSLNSNASFLSISQLGTVSGTPAFADRESTFWVEATILDYEGGLSDLVNYSLYVNNSAPTITNPISEDSGTVDVPYSRDFDFTDPNSDTGIWSLASNATFLSIDSAGTVSGTPDLAGTYYVDATITDYEGGLTDAVNYTLTVAAGGGDPPPGDGDSGFIPPPMAYFLHNNDVMNPGLVHFTYDGEGIARTFLWDFGDSSERSFERDPVHHYHFFLYGQWTVRLQVCGPTGCDEMTTTVALVDYRAVAFLVLGAVIILGGAIQTMKRRKT